MNQKDIVITALVLALVVLAGTAYYLYSRGLECKAMATDLGARLQECGAGVDQCMAGAEACQGILISLQQVPACASYIPTE